MFSGNMQRRATGYQPLEMGSRGQEFRHGRRRLNQVLEIVQQQQHWGAHRILQILLEYFERRLASRLPNSQRLNDHGSKQARIVQRGERYKMNAAWKALDQAAGRLQGETRFADPSGTRDRDQAHVQTQQEFFGGSYFLLAPYECGALHWDIARAGLHP